LWTLWKENKEKVNKINSYIQIDHFNGDIILSNNYKKFEANIILMLSNRLLPFIRLNYMFRLHYE